MTEQEQKQIAIDIAQDRIFTDRHIHGTDGNILGMVFMTLLFMEEADKLITAEEAKKGGFIYEYWNKAGPRAINGYPMFSSHRLVKAKDARKIWKYVRQYQKMTEQFETPSDKPPVEKDPDFFGQVEPKTKKEKKEKKNGR
jgi:hypothetical protein